MSFGLNNVPVIFSPAVITAFKEFIHKFLEVYFGDWTVFGLVNLHVVILHLMLDTCHAESKEMHILCSLWDPIGTFGVQARVDGGPC